MLGKHSELELYLQHLSLRFLEGSCLYYVAYIWQDKSVFIFLKVFFWGGRAKLSRNPNTHLVTA